LKAQGRPLAASLDSTVLNPMVFLLLLLFPLAQAFSLIVMGKMLLAGGFMYMALRRWKLSRGAALVGGIAYMFSGFNIVWLMWPHTLVTAFAPLLFYAVEGVVLDPGPRKTAILGAAVALLIVGGFPSVTAYFFMAAGLYFAVRVAHRQVTTNDWQKTLRSTAGFAVAFGFGIGLTAVQLLPTRDYADFADLSYRDSLSSSRLPHNQLIQLVFPNYNGNQVFGNFRGEINLNESSGYVGTVTLGLAMLGAAAGALRRRVVPIFFAVLAVGCVLIVYNIGPFLEIISRFPIFDTNPSTRLLSVFGFAAAALGAFGLDDLRRLRLEGVPRRVALVAGAAGVTVLVGVLGYLVYEMIDRWSLVTDFRDDFPIMDLTAFRVVTVALAVSLSLTFSVAVLAHLWRPLPARTLALVAVVVIAVDVLFFAYRQNPTIAEANFYPEPPSIEFLQENLSPGERMTSFDGTFMIPGTQAFYGLSGAIGHALYDERQRDLIDSFSSDAFKTNTAVIPEAAKTDFLSPAFDLLGLKYLTFVPGTGPPMAETVYRQRYRLVYSRADEVDIYEYRPYRDAFLVTNVVVEDEENALALVAGSRFDPA
ncbi:MAG: YfhO family protein, partial [Dehalococcoidia bacterium]